MKTLLLNVPSFSGKIVSPTWIKAVRDFQSKSKAERDSYCSACGCTGGCNLCDDISKYRIIPVSHKPKEERRMMFICGDDIASLIKRFENESK